MWNLINWPKTGFLANFFRTLRVLWDHQNRLLGTPKRLQNHVWAQLLLLNSNIDYLWQLDQVWSHLEQYRPRNDRKSLFLIFAKCSNGPFWAHQNRLFSSQNRYQTCIWAQMLSIDSNIATFRALCTEKTSKNTFFSFWKKCQNSLAGSSQKWHSWTQKCYLHQISPQTLLVDVIT